MVQTLFRSCLQHLGLLVSAVRFDTLVEHLKQIFFISERKKWKEHMSKTFLSENLFDTLYRRIRLPLRQCIISPETTLHGYSQLDYHVIHQTDIHKSYLIYFQVCNMLKIPHDRNRLNHCIFHCRMLCFVLIHNDQHWISWKKLGLTSSRSFSSLSESII